MLGTPVCVFKYAFWGTHLIKLITCQAPEYIIDILFSGENNDDPNVWAWPRLSLLFKICILGYSLNKTYNLSKAQYYKYTFHLNESKQSNKVY